MNKAKVTNQNLQTLVMAVGIVNTKSENIVVDLMKEWDVNKLSDISDSDLKSIEDWVTAKSESEKDPYKVGRALVWYIVKPYLDLPHFKNMKYPCNQ